MVFIALGTLCYGTAHAQPQQIVLDRPGSTIVLEPYAPNIIRVTLSTIRGRAMAKPGYGFIGSPDNVGWSLQHNDQAMSIGLPAWL